MLTYLKFKDWTIIVARTRKFLIWCLGLMLTAVSIWNAPLYAQENPPQSTAEQAKIKWSAINTRSMTEARNGQFEKSIEFGKQALKIAETEFGENHPDTLISVFNLAVYHHNQGLYGQARPLYERALNGQERSLGANHPDTLISVGNLGVLYISLGLYEQAEPLLLRGFHGLELAILNNLGFLYQLQNLYELAVPLYERIVETRERISGQDNFSTQVAISNLGTIYKEQGLYGQAESLYQRVLDASERVLGPDHPSTLVNVNNLGALYSSQGFYRQAEPLYQRALETTRRTIGTEHPNIVQYASNLGSLYSAKTNSTELGIFYWKQAVNVLQNMRLEMAELEDGTQSAFLETQRSRYESLQSALIDQGRFAEAALVGRMLKEQEFYDFIRRRSSEDGDPRQTVIAFTASEQDWANRMEDWRERPNRMAREYQALFDAKQDAKVTNGAWSDQDEARLQEASVSLDEANSAFRAKVDALTQELTERAADHEGQVSREIAELNLKAAQSYRRMLSVNGPTTALVQMISLPEATHLLFITSEAIVHEEVNLGRLMRRAQSDTYPLPLFMTVKTILERPILSPYIMARPRLTIAV